MFHLFRLNLSKKMMMMMMIVANITQVFQMKMNNKKININLSVSMLECLKRSSKIIIVLNVARKPKRIKGNLNRIAAVRVHVKIRNKLKIQLSFYLQEAITNSINSIVIIVIIIDIVQSLKIINNNRFISVRSNNQSQIRTETNMKVIFNQIKIIKLCL